MTRARGSFVLLFTLSLALGACGSSPGTAPASSPGSDAPGSGGASAPPTASPWSPHPLAVGYATDQKCTATAEPSADLAVAGVSPHDLPAMVLDRPTRVAPDWGESEPWEYGYLDNATGDTDVLGSGQCDAFAATGRMSGYFRTWQSATMTEQVASQVHAFATEQGAQDFLPWLVSGVAQGRDPYFDNAGQKVTGVSTFTLPDVGSDGPAYGLTLTAGPITQTWVGFRVGQIIGSVSAGGATTSMTSVSAEAMARAAVEQVQASPPSGTPYDGVLLLSLPVPLAELGEEFASYTWDACCSGSIDTWQLEESYTDPMGASRRADEGWVGTQRSRYSGAVVDGGGGPAVDSVSTGVNVFLTPQGAARSRAMSISLASAGAEFDVTGLEGAVGAVRVIRDGGTRYQDTRVVLPVHGSAVMVVAVGGAVGTDHRADAIRIATLLHERWNTLVGS